MHFESFQNLPPELATFLIAMIPIGELRAAIPFAHTYTNLSTLSIYVWAVLGNIFPIIFILLGLEKVSNFLRKHSKFADRFFVWLFKRTRHKLQGSYEKWGEIALALFVAIPLPITGAWTGAAAAYVFGIPKKRAFGFITLGVLISGIIVTLITKGIINIF